MSDLRDQINLVYEVSMTTYENGSWTVQAQALRGNGRVKIGEGVGANREDAEKKARVVAEAWIKERRELERIAQTGKTTVVGEV